MLKHGSSLLNTINTIGKDFDFLTSKMAQNLVPNNLVLRLLDGDVALNSTEGKINSGLFIIKNTRRAFKILQKWWERVDRVVLSDSFGFEGVYQAHFTPEEKSAILVVPPRILNSEYPIWKQFRDKDAILHLLGMPFNFRKSVFKFAYLEFSRAIQLQRVVATDHENPLVDTVAVIKSTKHNFGITIGLLLNFYCSHLIDDFNNVIRMYNDTTVRMSLSDARELFTMGVNLRDAITIQSNQDTINMKNVKEIALNHPNKAYTFFDHEADQMRKMNRKSPVDFLIQFPHAYEYTTLIHEGKLQQVGKHGITIGQMTQENLKYGFLDVVLYLTYLKNVGAMKPENDELVKANGRGLEEWPELLKYTAESGVLALGTYTV